MEEEDFIPLIHETWTVLVSYVQFVVAAKLKRVKVVLKQWKKARFRILETHVEESSDVLKDANDAL